MTNVIDALAGRTRPIDPAALPPHLDAASAEARWQAAWEEQGIYHYDASRGREETFVVDTPPPTASGSLHIGHVFSYTHQDVLVRHRRMKGLNVFYPLGWDDNGLPTERRVQNLFHVRCDPHVPHDPDLRVPPPTSGKPEGPARSISRRNFIHLCHEATAQDELAYKQLFQRLSLSVDWREEYATIDRRCRAIAQRSFLDLLRAGHAYQTDAPTMWDVDFQTAVAQAEIEDRDVASAFHDVEFAVEGGGAFTIATTRPELLAACVGVAAHPDDERYRPLFGRRAVTPLFRVPVPIFPTTLADPAKGTGILMVCTFGDQTDVLWWREQGLALRQIVGRDGRLEPRTFGTPGWESLDPDAASAAYAALAGRKVHQARADVVTRLRDAAASALPAAEARPPLRGEPRPLTHAVKYYERGERPLEIVTSRQWFVRLLDKRDRLLEMGRRIQWHPSHMLKRFENWTLGLQSDWCVSRQRYFGVPIPVWYRLDGEGRPLFEAPILPDPASLPMDPMSDAPSGMDPALRDRPGGFTGEADVFDTWFTSALTPLIAARHGQEGDRSARLLPMDVRPQSHEIIRTWAFYTIAKSMLHHDRAPWRHVTISGWILDPDRKKMSKSRGNVTTPMHLLDKYGSDAVRYWASGARLGADTAFDEKVMQNGKRLVTKLYNAAKFVLAQDAPGASAAAIAAELDRGFVAELRGLVTRAGEALDGFEFAPLLEAGEAFLWGAFTDNYIEMVKRRARREDDATGRASAVATLRVGLGSLLRLLAPVLPVTTEEIWSWSFAAATGHGSIHRSPWPTLEELAPVPLPGSPRAFSLACGAMAAIRRARTQAGVSLAAPLSRLTITGPVADLEELAPVLGDVRDAAVAPGPDLSGKDGAEGFDAAIEVAPASPA